MRIDPGFAALYEAEYSAVFRTAYLLCRNRALAEDATQEAFVRAFERWERLRDQSWAAGWVTSTALNLARRSLRRRRPQVIEREEGWDVDSVIDLWRRVRMLPLRQQQAVVLHYRLGLGLDEIAKAMSLAESTVRVHLARARRALRAELEEVPDA